MSLISKNEEQNTSPAKVLLEGMDKRIEILSKKVSILDTLILYCEEDLNYSHNMEEVEQQINSLLSDLYGGPKGELLIYEFMLNEVIIAYEEWSKDSAREFSYLRTKRAIRSFNNFLTQVFLRLEQIWEIPQDFFNKVESITLTPWFNPQQQMEAIGSESLLILINFRYKVPGAKYLTRNKLGIDFFGFNDLEAFEDLTKMIKSIQPSSQLKDYIQKINYSLHTNYLKIQKFQNKKSEQIVDKFQSIGVFAKTLKSVYKFKKSLKTKESRFDKKKHRK